MTRVRQCWQAIKDQLPYSCARGVAQARRGQAAFDAWVEAGRRAMERFDVAVILCLFACAGTAWMGAFFAQAWPIVLSGLSLAGVFFSMAAGLWISEQTHLAFGATQWLLQSARAEADRH